MTRERDIENELIRRVKAAGGEIRKVKWIGRKNAPDRLVGIPEKTIPHLGGAYVPFASFSSSGWVVHGISFWVELKRPGEVATAAQIREHNRMRKCGMIVFVCSTFEDLDGLPI